MRDCSGPAAKLVVVIRRDLRLSGDALVIHACHAGLGALEDITPRELEEWQMNEYETVVLAGHGEGELVRLDAVASMAGISSYVVRDTRGIAIAVGLGPSTGLDRVTGSLPLWYRQADTQEVVH